MNSPLLKRMAKRKTGWKPQLVVDTETKKARRDACMVTNGKIGRIVEVEGKDDREIDDNLQLAVLKLIQELEEKDRAIMLREVIIFSAIANASINQAQFFVPLIRQEAKMRLKQFVGDTEKFVDSIQKEAIEFHGDQMSLMLDNLEDATHRTFQKMGDAIISGRLPEFINMIESFDLKPEE